jgi:hypothetical protein
LTKPIQRFHRAAFFPSSGKVSPTGRVRDRPDLAFLERVLYGLRAI